jgi:hypothetical protein
MCGAYLNVSNEKQLPPDFLTTTYNGVTEIITMK